MDWWRALWMWVGSSFGGFTNWWNTLNIGNLSEAMAAFASLVVVVATLAAVRRENKRHRRAELQSRLDMLRARLDDYERLASQVSLVAERLSTTEVSYKVVNQSGRPIRAAILFDPQGPYVDSSAIESDGKWLGIALDTIGVVPSGEPYVGRCALVKRRDKNHEDLFLSYMDDYGNERWVFASGERGPKINKRSPVWQEGQTTWEELRRLDPAIVRFKRWRKSRRRVQGGSNGAPDRVTPQPTPPAPDPSEPPADRPAPGTAS